MIKPDIIELEHPCFRRSELADFFDSADSKSDTTAQGDETPAVKAELLLHSQLLSAFAELETRLGDCHQQREEQLRKTADDFNVFDYIAPDENLLSDVLRLLLDPEGSHSQGDTFLRVLITRANPAFTGDCQGTSVVREAVTYSIERCRRRIDVLVTVPGFILAIETKKSAEEASHQIHDYCEHLKNVAGENYCLIFLTRRGADACSIAPEAGYALQQKGRLKCWSWEREIHDWLTACVAKCEAPKIRHFISDFQSYIVTCLAAAVEVEENNEN